MSRLPVPGDDADVWGDILNDFLAVSHLDDGRIRVDALPTPQVADGSITPSKLDRAYVPTSQKGAANGVASLDGSGLVPIAQIPSGAVLQDATSTVKGIIQLAGDLGGTAASPTVPGLAAKYVKPVGGIPRERSGWERTDEIEQWERRWCDIGDCGYHSVGWRYWWHIHLANRARPG